MLFATTPAGNCQNVIYIVLFILTFIYRIVVFSYLHTCYIQLFNLLKAARVFNKISQSNQSISTFSSYL